MSDFRFDQDSRLDPPMEEEFRPPYTLEDIEEMRRGFFDNLEKWEGDFRSGRMTFPMLCEKVYRDATFWAACREEMRTAYDDAGVKMPPGSY